MRPGCINRVPPEILSEILLAVIESFGDDIYLKWKSPLLFMLVSKWLYKVAISTPSLWRYLYIRPSLHRYLPKYVSRSGSLPLIADVMDDTTYRSDKGKVWREIIDAMVPAFPRLKTLLFHSSWDNKPIIHFIQHKMPSLKSLDVRGNREEHSLKNDLLLSRLPSLRYLRSEYFFNFGNGLKIPGTVEELYYRSQSRAEIEDPKRFWDILPRGLRILKADTFGPHEFDPSLAWRVHFPSLTELDLLEYCPGGRASVLRYLDLPLLQKAVRGDRMLCWSGSGYGVLISRFSGADSPRLESHASGTPAREPTPPVQRPHIRPYQDSHSLGFRFSLRGGPRKQS